MSRNSERKTVHMVGHGHIDPTWLWRWTEGYEEVRATFRSALDRMKETPGFRFTASSACFYAWVKACDPEMFEEIRQRVREGRWEAAGGWWVEPDCNIPGGEAFVRHGLYSQRFFERELGVRARVGFNPDSFGHAGTLPQLYKKMGIEYYAYMRPEPVVEKDYPEGATFHWHAKDGSSLIASNIQCSYGADGDGVARMIEAVVSSPHLVEGQTHVLGFFGVGNHGGGPTKAAIQRILQAQADENGPEVVFSTLEGYFDGFADSMAERRIPVIEGELQHHARGCYSVHSEAKRLNRAAEHALMAAERLATVRWLVQGDAYPSARIEEAWKWVLYNQFHDILAGTSIESSYEDTRDQLGAARTAAHEIFNESLQSLARDIDTSAEGNTVVVFNPLPWPVTQPVRVGNIVRRALEEPIHFADNEGGVVASQPVQGQRIGHVEHVLVAEAPALGYRCYHARSGAKAAGTGGKPEAGRDFLENRWWRIEFDPYRGEITRLFDKNAQVEVLERGGILACMVDETDTWSHGKTEWRVERGRFTARCLDVYEQGDVCATVRVQQEYGQSRADQFVTLYAGIPRIDLRLRLDWHEAWTLLKLGFETTLADGVAACDTAYGFEERDTRGTEEPCQRWVALSGHVGGKPYGLAVLNDSKYSYDIRDGAIRLTLLRSPAYAFHDPSRYHSNEAWSIMDQGVHEVRVALVPYEGDWRTAGVVRQAWEFNEPVTAHIESAHGGGLPVSASFLDVDADHFAGTVLKRAEDGGSVIVRGYECAGEQTRGLVRFPHAGSEFPVEAGPHEIKTMRVDVASGGSCAANLLEETGDPEAP